MYAIRSYYARQSTVWSEQKYDLKLVDLSTGGSSTQTGIPFNGSSASRVLGYIKKIWFGDTASAPSVYFDNIAVYEDSSTLSITAPSISFIGDRFSSVTNSNPSIDVDFYDETDLTALEYVITSYSIHYTKLYDL